MIFNMTQMKYLPGINLILKTYGFIVKKCPIAVNKRIIVLTMNELYNIIYKSVKGIFDRNLLIFIK